MNKIKEELYTLTTDKVEKDTTITVLTDIHYSNHFKEYKLNLILNYVFKTKPDYICIPGDFIDTPEVLNNIDNQNKLKNWLKKLANIAPVFLVLGNHDITIESKSFFDFVAKYHYDADFYNSLNEIKNVCFLNNKQKEFDNIMFNGYSLPFNYYFKDNKCFEDVNTLINNYKSTNLNINGSNYNILLCHSPEYIIDDKVYKDINSFKYYDLIICGHMHSGIIRFGNNHGLINPQKRFFQNNCSGIIKKENTNLLVARQVTTFSGIAPKIFQLFNVFFPIYVSKIIIKRNNQQIIDKQ